MENQITISSKGFSCFCGLAKNEHDFRILYVRGTVVYGRQAINLPNLDMYHHPSIWVNYNDLTATSLEIMVNKGNHPQMALIQVSELLLFTQIYGD